MVSTSMLYTIYIMRFYLAVIVHSKQDMPLSQPKSMERIVSLAQQTSQVCPLGNVIIESKSMGTM